MNAGLNLSFNNKYHIELIDSTTGVIKQSGDFHNLTTDNIGQLIVGVAYESQSGKEAQGRSRIPVKIAVGNGTDAPKASDTSLTSQLWIDNATLQNFTWVDDYTASIGATVTFPANASYVGSVSEVGIYGGFWWKASYSSNWDTTLLATKSLLTDSEGQPVSFTKTDLDILKVTVTFEMSLRSTNEDFILFKRNKLLYNMLKGTYGNNNTFDVTYGKMNLCRFHNTVEGYYGELPDGTLQTVSLDQVISSVPIGTYSGRSGRVSYPVTRLGADEVTSERYFKAIAIPGVGYWKLPNENVFPTYEIKNISVGIGDGVTTQFPNPLCYFKKDSDKVYKNGVQLTRDVDYRLNSQGNSKCLQEINEFALPSKVTSAATSVTTLNSWVPLFVPNTVAYMPTGTRWFSNTNPLYLEYNEPVTLNCFVSSGDWKKINGTNGYDNLPVGTIFYLDASEDGITYNEVTQATIAASNGGFDVKFADTTAKYWRVRISYSGTIAMASKNVGPDNNYIALNYRDPYITFTEAPADGDVITMDVGMDVIMKNSNFVIDIGVVLNFTW